jgi:membrane protein required for colicin V production
VENFSINIVDTGLITLLILSAITGLILGFVRSGLFVMSWLGAATTTFIFFPHVKPYSRQYIEHDFFADITAGLIVFIITLVIFFLISSVVGGWVRNSRLNALDRSLGMLAGIITSSIIIAGGYILVERIWPIKKQPIWMLEAKAVPLVRKGAEALKSLLPDQFQVQATKVIRSKASGTRKLIEKEAYERFIRPNYKKKNTLDRTGYDTKERRGIENLLNKTQ